MVTGFTSSGPHTLPWRLPLTLTCTDWPAPVVVPSPPQRRPGRRFGIHRRRGMPTYGIGLCLGPWTSHTSTVYHGASQAAPAMFPLYSPACSQPPCKLCLLLLPMRCPTARSHRHRAIPPHHCVCLLPASASLRAHDRHLPHRRATGFVCRGQMVWLCTCPQALSL